MYRIENFEVEIKELKNKYLNQKGRRKYLNSIPSTFYFPILSLYL